MTHEAHVLNTDVIRDNPEDAADDFIIPASDGAVNALEMLTEFCARNRIRMKPLVSDAGIVCTFPK